MRNQEIIGLMEAYSSIYANLSESHFKVGDEVVCKKSGMEGEVVKVDSEEKGKYYTVKREDGKTMKYAPSELKLESEKEEKEEEKGEKEDKEDVKEEKNGGATEFCNGYKVQPTEGKLIIFPCCWMYVHRGCEIINDANKYIITTFINASD